MQEELRGEVENVIRNANEEQPNLTVTSKHVDKADRQGFTEQFRGTEEGLELLRTGKIYRAEDIKVANYFREEGISDPDDMEITYLIETCDGMKGTLTDAYGTYSDANVARIITEVEDIHKKVNSKQ
ncbi:MAG TPA: hypothetical protein VM012_12410 [Flavitalea sp.]|nr:hypothetical protein [Flavitalea sp.]